MNIIRKLIRKIIEEGLIRTENIKNSIAIINRNFPNFVKASLIENNKVINIAINYIDTNQIKKLLVLINNLGYFVSTYNIGQNTYKFSEKDFISNTSNLDINKFAIELSVEAKFDGVDKDIPAALYHVTDAVYIKKIRQIGLVPKSKSKKAYHPERIYLAKTKDDAIAIVSQFVENNYAEKTYDDYYLIEIDYNRIREIRFFKDPNFIDGYYVLENIPRDAIINITNIGEIE